MNDPIFFINDFIQFFYLENIGVDTKIMILCQLEVEILLKLDFQGGHLKQWTKLILRPKEIPRNIANNIPRKPLIKMVRDWGAWWPILAHGLPVSIINEDMNKNRICWSKNCGHFEFRMILTSGHIKTLSNRFSTLKNPQLDILIIKIGQLVQKILP